MAGLAAWQVSRVESIPALLVFLVPWFAGLALAYWTFVIWQIVFSAGRRRD